MGKPEVVYCDFIDDEEYNRFSYEEMIRILREGIIARKIGRYIFGISVMILFLCFKTGRSVDSDYFIC